MVVVVEGGAGLRAKGKSKGKSKVQNGGDYDEDQMNADGTGEDDTGGPAGGLTRIGIISVVPSTGDVVWDEFSGN